MKKILASIMMGSLIFCLSACNMPWQKKDTQKEVKREVIQADKVQGTMKDMTLKVGVSNDMAPFSYYDKDTSCCLQFKLYDDNHFEAYALEFNGVPQSKFMKNTLIDEVMEDARYIYDY